MTAYEFAFASQNKSISSYLDDLWDGKLASVKSSKV